MKPIFLGGRGLAPGLSDKTLYDLFERDFEEMAGRGFEFFIFVDWLFQLEQEWKALRAWMIKSWD